MYFNLASSWKISELVLTWYLANAMHTRQIKKSHNLHENSLFSQPLSHPLLNGSFGGNISSFFKTAVTPLFFHPFTTVSLPSAVVRTLYNSINQFACKTFREVSLRLTSLLSAGIPASICFLISPAYQVTNFFLKNFLRTSQLSRRAAGKSETLTLREFLNLLGHKTLGLERTTTMKTVWSKMKKIAKFLFLHHLNLAISKTSLKSLN